MLNLSALLQMAHTVWRDVVSPGDTVLDATAGNGHDTLFLAGLVAPAGLVLALDRQKDALDRTYNRLSEAGLAGQVRLLSGVHREMARILAVVEAHSLALAVFNLGFLPGSDKRVRTDAASTLAALDAVWPLLRTGAILSVHTYSGHEGAQEEADAVATWMKALAWRDAQVTACTQWNKPHSSETLYLAVRKGKVQDGCDGNKGRAIA